MLNPAVLNLGNPLQEAFTRVGLTLQLAEKADAARDALYIGTFEKYGPAKEYLVQAGITVTWVTKEEGEEETSGEEKPKSTIAIKGMGTFDITGTQLFLVSRSAARTALVVLAEDRASLEIAVNRLLSNDFSGCVTQGDVTLCAEEVSEWTDGGGGPPAEKQPRIFILAVDSGTTGGAQSDAPALEAALSSLYDSTVWYTSVSGFPTIEDMTGFDAYIIDTGDYAYDQTVMDSLPAYALEKNWIYIGEQPVAPSSFTETATLNDLKVTDAKHPLASGFKDGEIIQLSESVSGVPALVLDSSDGMEGIGIVFSRGPDSPNVDAPVVIAYEIPDTGTRFAVAAFAFYRLPEDAQTKFAVNIVEWLLEH